MHESQINYHKHIVVNFQHESYTCNYPIGVVINYHKHIVVNFQHESHTCKYPIGLTSLDHNITNLFIIRIIATYNYELSSPQIKYNSISHFTQIKTQLFIHIGIALYLQRTTILQFRFLNSEFGDVILCCRRCFDLVVVALSFRIDS